MIKQLFWNASEHRLRAGWRLVLQLILFFILLIPLNMAAGLLGGLLLMLLQGASLEEVLAGFAGQAALNQPVVAIFILLATLIAVVGSVRVAGRFLDRRRFADFGLHFDRNWWIDLGFGLALGAALMLLIFLVEWAAGWVTVIDVFYTGGVQAPFLAAILLPLFQYICVGIYEELLSRGYHLKNLSEGLKFMGSKGAVVTAMLLSSAVFGIAHAANPNATAVSTFNIFLAGIFLALGAILTGELAIPIGLHITWNFFQGNVFGFPVSGGGTPISLIAIEQGGDPLLTGGAFGPEAGLIGIAAIVLGSVATIGWVQWRYGRVRLYTPLATPDLLPRSDPEQEQIAETDSQRGP